MRLLIVVVVLGSSLLVGSAVGQGPVTSVGALADKGVGLTRGPDGALWHTTRSTVGFTTVAGRTTTFSAGSSADAGAITSGPDGALWFIRSDDEIARVSPAGLLTRFDDVADDLRSITLGPDGNLWFAAKEAIGRLKPGGQVTTFGDDDDDDDEDELPGRPRDIAAGADGALWVTYPENRRVGRVTTSGQLDDFHVGGEPTSVAAGPDGALWITDRDGSILRVGLNRSAKRFAGAGEKPGEIAAGPDGALWYTLEHGVGRITTAGAITRRALGSAKPVTLAAGPDGAMYFTNEASKTLGRIALAQPPAPAAPTATPRPAPIVPPAALPKPRLNRTVVVARTRGRVRVRRPGGRFRVLDAARGVPMGSVLDTRRGAVTLRSATARGTQKGIFYGGLFAVRQRGRKGHTDVLLRGRLDCGARGAKPAGASVARKRPKRSKRRVWGKDAGGRYSTHGRDSVTTVRGTRWLTVDTCRGTLTRVTEGSVVVRDRATGKRHVVRAGRRHFARHRR